MIAKRAPRRKDSKSSIKALSQYITNIDDLTGYISGKNNRGKAEYSYSENCLSENIALAVAEIKATQAMNTRTGNDKNYHLVISFREGEKPGRDQVIDIVASTCKAIGLGDHQRIISTHHDTDNYHIHVAINKIHLKTFNCIEPHYDYYKLSDICAKLELKHGLKRDKHIDQSKRPRTSGRTKEMEKHTGLESFQSWVRGSPATALKSTLINFASWDHVHKTLAQYNLEIRKRGNGLVISDESVKLFIKASSISRDFSKSSLEKKLGIYQPSKNISADLIDKYRKTRLHDHVAGNQLWKNYQNQRNAFLLYKRKLLNDLLSERQQWYRRIIEIFAKRRVEIRTDVLIRRKRKQALYSTMRKQRIDALSLLKKNFADKRKKIHAEYKVKSWQEFLMDEVLNGNIAALQTLRSNRNYVQKGAESNIIQGKNISEAAI